MRTVLSLLSAHVLTVFPALGQTLGTGDQPRCFFWETAPTAWDGSNFDQRFMPMIRVDVLAGDGEPNTIADNVKAAVEALVTKFGSTHEIYIRSHICILLQNFGSAGVTKFAQDPVDEPDWVEEGDEYQNAEGNPWLNTGSEDAKDWMEEFIYELSHGANIVTPFRFHFDTEIPLCQYYLRNDVLVAWNVFDDSGATNGGRWNSSSWKIPHGDPGALTLKQHWDAAVTAYGWPSDPHDLIDFTGRPFHALTGGGENNRAFFLWYQRILDRCRDYAMKYSAYDQILAQWPSCEISNYEDTNIPQGFTVGTSDVFGWQFNFSTANDPVPQPEDSFPSREFPLGYFKSQNASYGHEVSGTYFITPGNFRSGTMNAPVLYAVSTVHHTNGESEVIQRNLYEPHADDCATVQSGDCDAPIETQWRSSLRIHRHWIESILLSGDEPETISPWVTLPAQALFGHTLTEDDLSLQLCMLRAKNIPELLVWNDHTTGDTEQEWLAFQCVYERVYTPILDDTNLAEGAIVSGSGLHVERVRRTLFDGNDLPHVIALESATLGSDEVTALDVHFDDMTPHSGQTLRIIIESGVEPDEEPEPGIPAIYGQVMVWDPDIVDWIVLDLPDHDDVSQVPAGRFGYYTPDFTGRRIFDIKDCRVREIGETHNQFTIRIVHTAQEPFKAMHDLVQVVWSGEYTDCNCDLECNPEEGPENLMRGADIDYNRAIDSTDAAAFDAAYFAQSPTADLNRDGQVNETDQVLFAERFGG
ncbi:MAG: hypothetical protein JNK25_15765 [Phycisphaerae bacterium]|nr:hypothetical protein [Phycisphaerae bacterium]